MLKLNQFLDRSSAHVLVLGAGGFVGGASAAKLEKEGYKVERVTRRDLDLASDGAAAALGARLRAETTLVFASARAPVKDTAMLLENLRMISAVVEAVKASPVAHLVYISSDAVYSDSSSPLTEASVAEPESLHGVMHLAREVVIKNELFGIPQAVVRPTLIFGPGDPHNGYGPNRFVRCIARGEDVTLFGEGEERRDHVFIDDVAEIVARCVSRRATGVVNAVSGVVTSFREIAEVAVRVGKASVGVHGSPRKGPMPHGGYRAFDSALLRAVFPDHVPVDLISGLAHMFAALRA